VANGVVYVGSYDGTLYAYAVGCNSGGGSCTPLWTATTWAKIYSSPAVANGVVYVGSADGKLYAYAVGCNSGGGSCTPLWTATTGVGMSSPAVADGVVYVGSADGKLYAYAVGCNSGGGSCTPLWTATTGVSIYWSSPAVANGVVYVGSDDGKLYAFELNPLDHLVLSPASATIAPGGSQAYTAEGFDASNNSLGDVTSATTFTISGTGSCTAASCTSTVAGDHTVTGTDGSAHGTAVLHVTGTLDHYIKGTVTGTGGTPLAGIQVDAGSSDYYGGAQTASDGTYSILVPAGTYTVSFWDCSGGTYLHGYYGSGGFTLGSGATPVAVSTSDVSGIDVQMQTGHYIKGTVTGTGGTPLASIYVGAGSSGYSGTTWTASDGTYSVAVAPGTYTVQFNDPSGTYFSGLYSSGGFTLDQGSATPVTVTTSDRTGIDVQMLTVPGKPTGVTAVRGNGSALVSWTAPANGGSAITGYTVTSSPGAKTCTTATLSCSVSGLTNGTAYTFTVTATNIVGTGPASDPSSSIVVNLAGATYHALTPTRLLDSRDGYWIGLAGAFSSHVARTFGVTGRGGVPSNAVAVTGNLTVTGQTSLGYLYIGPNAANNPTSSTLNFPLGDDRANGVTVALGAGGTLSVTYVAVPGATAQVIFDVTGYFTPDSTGATYHALTPTRLLDSRDGYWIGLAGSFSSHSARTFQVTGRGGVPSNAIAVTGNLTVTEQTSLDYLYVGPNAANNPTSSTLNFPLGDDRANAVTVALGGGGTLSATYVAVPGATAQVIFDVTGYFTPDSTGATYVPLTPARVLDSCDGYWIGLAGASSSHVARTFGVTGHGGVPANAIAVTGNLTVTGQTALGYLYVGPNAMNNPTSSTLNFPTGDDRANAVTVALGAGGTLSVTYVAAPGATAQVIFDVTGYFTP
jgi:hypothetical protein